MRLSPVEDRHAYRSIVDQVCDAILRGDLRKDDWLPSEREMAEQSGLSRSSVRQALEVLNEAGLVVMKPGGRGGTQVVSEIVPTELLGQAIETSYQRLLDVCEVRNMLEVSAAQLAVGRATNAQIQGLEAIVDEVETLMQRSGGIDAPEDPQHALNAKQEWLRLDIAFHHAVVRMCGNEYLVRTYTGIFRNLLQLVDMASMSEFASYGPASMRQFVEALKWRDFLGVQMAIYAHVYPAAGILQRYHKAPPRVR